VIVKEYEALVCGHLPLPVESGVIDLPLQRDVHHPPFMRVSTPTSEQLARRVVDALRERNWTNLTKRNPKSSQTKFRVLSREYIISMDSCCDNKRETSNNSNNGTDSSSTSTHNGSTASSSFEETTKEQHHRFPVTRLSLTPLTGRTHQLRAHLAAIGFPIVGDPAYGLYGESAFCAGLYHNRVLIKQHHQHHHQQHHCRAATTTTMDHSPSTSTLTSSSSLWRAPISLQKEIMELYPPGEKDMCLHAARLGIPHPTTGKQMMWNVPPKF